jgi:hypothetical protein
MNRLQRVLGGALLAALAGCPKPKADQPKQPDPIPAAPTSWCDSIGGYMKGFECLTLAGEVDLASFGPSRDQLSEGTLASCFGGKLPSEIPVKTQSAMLPSYRQDWSSQFDANSGLDLQKVSTWLPNANLKGERNRNVTVEISFESLERVQISDVAQTFRSKIAGSSAKSTLGRLDSCRKRLCKAEYLTVVEVLRGFPKITISTDGEFNYDTQIGWDAQKVDIGVNSEGGTKNKSALVMQRAKDAGPVVVAARVLSLSNSMSTDDLCKDDAMSLGGTEKSGGTSGSTDKTTNAPTPPTKPSTSAEEAARRETVRKLLGGESLKNYAAPDHTWTIGDLYTLPKREDAYLVNEAPVSSLDGKHSFKFGDTCTLDAGEQVKIVGFYKEGLFTEALVKYTGGARATYACPPGALFFRFF